MNEVVGWPDSERFVAQLIAWGAANPAIFGMLLTSTRAVGRARVDRLSDYDVILVIDTVEAWVGRIHGQTTLQICSDHVMIQ